MSKQTALGIEVASSTGSSSNRARMNNIKHYTETARLQEAIRFHSTLEDEEPLFDDNGALLSIRNIAGINYNISSVVIGKTDPN